MKVTTTSILIALHAALILALMLVLIPGPIPAM